MRTLTAEMIAIGDELLDGLPLNTNAQGLYAALSQLGAQVVQTTPVGDQEEALLDTFVFAEIGYLRIAHRGLGPTEDDRTKAH